MEALIHEIDAERGAKNAPKKPCFVVAPIGEPGSDSRLRSDKVLRHVIRPAVDECGYHATRADEIAQPGLITTQVIDRVLNDPLVIADLTERNPNVFYELALRHAIRKPFIQLIRAGDQIPFDVAGLRTIQIDHTDLDSAAAAKQEIIDQIKSIEASPAGIVTPVSVSIDIRSLAQSGTPEDRSLAAIMTSITELRASIDSLQPSALRSLSTAETLTDPAALTSKDRAVLGKLPTDERAIYGLRAAGLSHRLIAQILGMSVKTIIVKLERAQHLLETTDAASQDEPSPAG